MNKRSLNMKMSRKTKPVDTNKTSNGMTTRVLRQNRNSSVKDTQQPAIVPRKKQAKEKSKKAIREIPKRSLIKDIPVAQVPVEVDSRSQKSNEDKKTRSRRPDAANYIKRRFLYSDESNTHEIHETSISPTKQTVSTSSRFRGCSSTAALMAASSANLLQKKRKKQMSNSVSSSHKLPKLHNRASRHKDQSSPESYVSPNLSMDFTHNDNDDGSDTDRQTFSDSDASLPSSYLHRKSPHSRFHNYLDEKEYHSKSVNHKSTREYADNQLEQIYSSDEMNTANNQRFSPFSHFLLDDNMSGLPRSGDSHIFTNKSRHDFRQLRRVRGTNSTNILSRKNYADLEGASSDEEFRSRSCLATILPTSESVDNGLQLSQQAHDMCMESSELALESGENMFIPHESRAVVDVDEFAGDLLPQRVVTMPATGSSRRKSPIRPMQVVRTEPVYFNDQNREHVSRDPRSYGGMEDPDQRYCTEEKPMYPPHLLQQSETSMENCLQSFSDQQHRTGLVDLCAAAHGELADLHSTNESYNLSPSSPVSTYPSLVDRSIPTDQEQLSPIGQIHNGSTLKQMSIPSGHVYLEGGSAGVRPEMPTYFLPTRSAAAKYSQGSYSHTSPASSKPAPSVGSSSSCLKSSASTRRRPAILKRVVGSAVTASSSSTTIKAPSVVSLVQSSNAPRFQPPFLRTITSFTPVSGVSLVSGASFEPALVSKSLTSPVAAAGGQILRLVSPNASNASLTYAVVSCSPNTASSAQTASSRLFGRRSYSGDTVSPVAFIKNQNACVTPLIASPLRYTVVRGAADGKKYVFLGSPPNQSQQSSDAVESRFEASGPKEVPHSSDETAAAVEFVASWNSASSTTPNASIDLAALPSPSLTNLSEFAAVS